MLEKLSSKFLTSYIDTTEDARTNTANGFQYTTADGVVKDGVDVINNATAYSVEANQFVAQLFVDGMCGSSDVDALANPYFNPSQTNPLEQIFILDVYRSSLRPTNLIRLDNTKTPEYLPLDEITNNMLLLDTE